MIGKIIRGESFKVCLDYVMGKRGAEIVSGNIFGDNTSEYAKELEFSVTPRPRLAKQVYHIILSLPVHEKLEDESWVSISKQYLNNMGFTNNQYIGVKHTDKDHEHVHLITNCVRLDGSVVNDSWERIRNQKVVREIEQQFGLTPVKSCWESDRCQKTKSQINKESKTGIPTRKTQIADKVDLALTKAANMHELIAELSNSDVEVKISRDRSGKPGGISYKLDDVSVAGSRVGREYSLSQILKKLEKQKVRQAEKNQISTIIPNDVRLDNARDIQKALIGINQISGIIRDNLTSDITMPELIARLRDSGVSSHVKYTRTQKIKGISFGVGNDRISGNELGKEYSWNGLQKYLQVSFDAERDNPLIQKMQREVLEVIKPILESDVEIPVETNYALQVEIIGRKILDELDSKNFVGKDYRIRLDKDRLTITREGNSEETVLQVTGQEVEINNLTKSDMDRFVRVSEEIDLQREKSRRMTESERGY